MHAPGEDVFNQAFESRMIKHVVIDERSYQRWKNAGQREVHE